MSSLIVRGILTKAARRPHIGVAFRSAAQEFDGVDKLPSPQRENVTRAVDFVAAGKMWSGGKK